MASNPFTDGDLHTPQSSTASQVSYNPSTGRSTVVISSPPILSSEAVRMSSPNKTDNPNDDAVIINGVKYVKVADAQVKNTNFKELVIPNLGKLNADARAAIQAQVHEATSKILDSYTATLNDGFHLKGDETTLSFPGTAVCAVGDTVNTTTVAGPHETAVKIDVPNSTTIASIDAITTVDSWEFGPQMFELVTGAERLRKKFFVHISVAYRLFEHPDFDHFIHDAEQGKTIQIEADIQGTEILLSCLYAQAFYGKLGVLRSQPYWGFHESFYPFQLYLAASYFKLGEIKHQASLLFPTDCGADSFIQYAKAIYDSDLLDGQFRCFFKDNFFNVLQDTLKGNHNNWAYSPSRDTIGCLRNTFVQGGTMASDMAESMLQGLVVSFDKQLSVRDDTSLTTPDEGIRNKSATENIPTPPDFRNDEENADIDSEGDTQSQQTALAPSMKCAGEWRNNEDWNSSAGNESNCNWGWANIGQEVSIETVEPQDVVESGCLANNAEQEGLHCNTLWAIHNSNNDVGHSDNDENPHTYVASKSLTHAQFAVNAHESSQTHAHSSGLSSYQNQFPFQHGPPLGSWAGYGQFSAPQIDFTAVAIQDSATPSCSLAFKTGDTITNVKFVLTPPDCVPRMSGVCNGWQGSFPASYVRLHHTAQYPVVVPPPPSFPPPPASYVNNLNGSTTCKNLEESSDNW